MSKSRNIALVYVGDGSAWRCPLGTVPTRDLTAEEVEFFGGAELLMSTSLYARPAPKKRPQKGQKEVNDGKE